MKSYQLLKNYVVVAADQIKNLEFKKIKRMKKETKREIKEDNFIKYH